MLLQAVHLLSAMPLKGLLSDAITVPGILLGVDTGVAAVAGEWYPPAAAAK